MELPASPIDHDESSRGPAQPVEAAIEALGSALARLATATEELVARVERREEESRPQREAAAIQERIERLLQQVDADAADQLERARYAAATLVEQRRREIASLSEGLTAQAVSLTSGLADGARVKAQFTRFVEALSIAAERLADGEGEILAYRPGSDSPESGLKRTERTRPLIVTGPSSSISTSRPESPASGSAGASGAAA